MKKKYDMPLIAVVRFGGEADVICASKCAETEVPFPQGASTYGLIDCGDLGPVPGGSGSGNGDGNFGPIS